RCQRKDCGRRHPPPWRRPWFSARRPHRHLPMHRHTSAHTLFYSPLLLSSYIQELRLSVYSQFGRTGRNEDAVSLEKQDFSAVEADHAASPETKQNPKRELVDTKLHQLPALGVEQNPVYLKV